MSWKPRGGLEAPGGCWARRWRSCGSLHPPRRALGVRCGSAFHVIWNQEREKAGLTKKGKSEDVTPIGSWRLEAVRSSSAGTGLGGTGMSQEIQGFVLH